MTLRLRIADVRRRLGLSQEAAAELAGASRSNLAKIEAGFVGWSDRTLRRYAAALRVKDYELLGYDMPPTADLPATHRRLAALIASLDEYDALVVLNVIEAQLKAKAATAQKN